MEVIFRKKVNFRTAKVAEFLLRYQDVKKIVIFNDKVDIDFLNEEGDKLIHVSINLKDRILIYLLHENLLRHSAFTREEISINSYYDIIKNLRLLNKYIYK